MSASHVGRVTARFYIVGIARAVPARKAREIARLGQHGGILHARNPAVVVKSCHDPPRVRVTLRNGTSVEEQVTANRRSADSACRR